MSRKIEAFMAGFLLDSPSTQSSAQTLSVQLADLLKGNTLVQPTPQLQHEAVTSIPAGPRAPVGSPVTLPASQFYRNGVHSL